MERDLATIEEIRELLRPKPFWQRIAWPIVYIVGLVTVGWLLFAIAMVHSLK